ncbi:unnamed protein product [Discula destructiva]
MDVSRLVLRQSIGDDTFVPGGFVEGERRVVPFWYTRTGVIVKWTLFLSLITFLTLYIILGYLHAKRRIRKGLAPLAYHRWLVPRAELARADPRYAFPHPAQYNVYRPPGAEYYGMQPNMPPPPPPMYDPMGRPPMYEPGPPPAGATKADPNQQAAPATTYRAGTDEEYGAPSGPPPSHLAPEHTGSTNPYRL